jgi:hypothetical protein
MWVLEKIYTRLSARPGVTARAKINPAPTVFLRAIFSFRQLSRKGLPRPSRRSDAGKDEPDCLKHRLAPLRGQKSACPARPGPPGPLCAPNTTATEVRQPCPCSDRGKATPAAVLQHRVHRGKHGRLQEKRIGETAHRFLFVADIKSIRNGYTL